MTSRPSRRTKRGLCSLAESQKRHSKLNQLADVVNDPKRMGAVNPALAAAMLTHGKGIEIGAFDTHLDLSRVNETLYAEDVKKANQATRLCYGDGGRTRSCNAASPTANLRQVKSHDGKANGSSG